MLRAVTEVCACSHDCRTCAQRDSLLRSQRLMMITPPAVAFVEGKGSELAGNEVLVCRDTSVEGSSNPVG